MTKDVFSQLIGFEKIMQERVAAQSVKRDKAIAEARLAIEREEAQSLLDTKSRIQKMITDAKIEGQSEAKKKAEEFEKRTNCINTLFEKKKTAILAEVKKHLFEE